jgi:thiol-disulfide isomerase/thioredoxin
VTRRSAAIGAIAVVLGSVLVLSLAWGLQHAAISSAPVLGREAPRLAILTSGGNQVGVRDLQGKPVVLNFWASWCGPCIEEGGVLSDAATANPSIAFVGANNRDTPSAFRAFEERHPHPYPAGPIVTGTYQSYGVAGLPATFFINSHGVVVAAFSGPLDAPTLKHYIGMIQS